MKFGPVPIAESAGLIAAHTVQAGEVVVRKGRPIPEAAASRLAETGLRHLVAARLDAGDIGEDEAAERLAGHVGGEGLTKSPPFTGRCNLHAAAAGVLRVDRASVDAINAVDEAITLATLPEFRPVVAGELVATVKIIPYAVAGSLLAAACRAAQPGSLSLLPYMRQRVGVISTRLPGLKDSVVDKTLRNLAARLEPTGAAIEAEVRVPHAAADVAAALRTMAETVDIVTVFGASAIADRRDVIPAGIEAAGGRVDHLGMPVDPGNLLLVGALGDVPVIGAPGCARSPKENGFDWVLHRLLAGLAVTRADIVGLGVGGLLTEIVSRPQPRGGGASADEDG